MAEPDGNRKPRFSRLFSLLFCLLACFYYYHCFFNRSHLEIEIVVDQKTEFKIYWAAEKELFSEKRRTVVPIGPEQSSYSFFLTDLSRVERLRIDPMAVAGEVLVQKITISQIGFKTITVNLEQLQPLQQIAGYSLEPDGLHIDSAGEDPNFLYMLSIEKAPVNWLAELLRFGLICLVVILGLKMCMPLQRNYLYVVVMLGVALVFIVTMAAVSKRNAHPDEYVHLNAARYYQENWLPPRIDDPAIENSYSVYGISRLNNGEIYYLLAGKFSQAVAVFHMSDLFSLRLFNIFLFGCIFFYAAASIPARLLALPFLLSPQVWYLFSYCVSDAFGLFLCFIAGCELVRPNSLLNRLFDPEKERTPLLALFFISVILALLILLKINYDPFIGLFYLLIIVKILKGSPDGEYPGFTAIGKKRLFIRLVYVTLLASALAGLRFGTDYYVNGPDRQLKIESMQEKTAHPWYKPSTSLHDKHVSMYLKARGTTLQEMIEVYQWFEHSFDSGFGLYGYFTVEAPEIYYELAKWAFAALLLYCFLVIGVKGSMEERLLALLSVCLAIALIGASLHRSWTVDFQAQGRYLFPILPILGVLLARSRHLFGTRLFTLLVSQLFFLAVYSFVFVALISIPRLH